MSGTVTPSSGNKEVQIVEIEQANPKDGSKPCKRTATCEAADFSESCELKKTIDANLSIDPVASKTDLDIVSDNQQHEPVPEDRAEILDAIDSDIAKHVEEQNLHDKTITAFPNKSFHESHGMQKTVNADERKVDQTNITENFTREGLCTTAVSSAWNSTSTVISKKDQPAMKRHSDCLSNPAIASATQEAPPIDEKSTSTESCVPNSTLSASLGKDKPADSEIKSPNDLRNTTSQTEKNTSTKVAVVASVNQSRSDKDTSIKNSPQEPQCSAAPDPIQNTTEIDDKKVGSEKNEATKEVSSVLDNEHLKGRTHSSSNRGHFYARLYWT